MSMETPRNLIWRYIREIKTCMMVTHAGGNIGARPMQFIPRPEQNAIWFFTDIESYQAHHVQDGSRTCLTFADVRECIFVSVTGEVTRVTAADTIKDLWNDTAAKHFPRGPEDPTVVLLRFDPEAGQYWDAHSSRIAMAINFLAATIIGARPSLGTSGTAELASGRS